MNIITMQIKNQENTNMGGAYERYMTLINALLSEGWEVHHISPNGFSNIKNELLIHHGVWDIPFYPHFLLFHIQTFFKMFKINRNNNIDLIITFSPLEAVMGVIFTKIFNKNTTLITFFRADSIANYESNAANFRTKLLVIFQKEIDRFIVHNVENLFFLSKKTRDDILGRINHDKKNNVNVVYNGITPRLRSLSKKKARKFKYKKVIGFVGLLYEGKGLNYLIKSFKLINEELPDSILVIVGDGPDKSNFIKTVEDLNLRDNVIFTGYKKNPIQYIKGFDIMVVPSLAESFGMVILEGLYVGTPVIGSNIGGIPEVLLYDELLFDPKTIEEISNKIIKFFKNENYHENIVNLCSKRRKEFDFDWETEILNIIINCRDYNGKFN